VSSERRSDEYGELPVQLIQTDCQIGDDKLVFEEVLDDLVRD
jgi:hypothetical protein